MVETIFSSPLSFEVILPFLAVFLIVFGVLEKAKILGDGKHRLNALLSLVIGLIVISFGYAVYLINNLIPFLAVSLVIILVFLILIGALYKEGELNLNDKMRWTIIGIIAIAVVGVVLYLTGAWNYLAEFFESGGAYGQLFANLLIIALIIGVVAFVLTGKDGESSGKSKS